MKILVIAGGESTEREVSLESGQCVAEALRSRGHQVDVLDPASDVLPDSAAKQWQAAFPLVHGKGGEDGVLQTQLCELALPYVGSSAAASELTFDKIRTNAFLADYGIVVPRSVVVTRSAATAESIATIDTLAPFEGRDSGIVTKPPQQGSSVGVSIVRSEREVESALRLAFQYDDRCLVEKYIAGREMTVPVVDGVAFPAIEIAPQGEWYDYQSKYEDDRTRYSVNPANQPPLLAEIAVNACHMCEVTGVARVDFRVDKAGQPWLLEVNTVPGMTSHSLVPKSAAALGISLGELCESAIRTALNS